MRSIRIPFASQVWASAEPSTFKDVVHAAVVPKDCYSCGEENAGYDVEFEWDRDSLLRAPGNRTEAACLKCACALEDAGRLVSVRRRDK